MRPPESERGPRQGPASDVLRGDRRRKDSASRESRQIRHEVRFHRLTERLYQLGPRPVAEAMLEVAAGRDLIATLEAYATLDPATVARLGGRDWPPLPLRRVA